MKDPLQRYAEEEARWRGRRATESGLVTEQTHQLVDSLLDHHFWEDPLWYEGAIEARLEMKK